MPLEPLWIRVRATLAHLGGLVVLAPVFALLMGLPLGSGMTVFLVFTIPLYLGIRILLWRRERSRK